MIFKFNNIKINTNLAGPAFQKLNNNLWELGFITENPGLTDPENDIYFKDSESKLGDNNKIRIFKNKVPVKLISGETKKKHIIHWVESENYFCITNDEFWNNFDD